jgi:hypothetical protein
MSQPVPAVAKTPDVKVTMIICQACLSAAEKCVENNQLSPAVLMGTPKRFGSDSVIGPKATEHKKVVKGAAVVKSHGSQRPDVDTKTQVAIEESSAVDMSAPVAVVKRRGALDLVEGDAEWTQDDILAVRKMLTLYPVRASKYPAAPREISLNEFNDACLNSLCRRLVGRTLESVRKRMEMEYLHLQASQAADAVAFMSLPVHDVEAHFKEAEDGKRPGGDTVQPPSASQRGSNHKRRRTTGSSVVLTEEDWEIFWNDQSNVMLLKYALEKYPPEAGEGKASLSFARFSSISTDTELSAIAQCSMIRMRDVINAHYNILFDANVV